MEYNLARAAQTAYNNSKKKSVFTMPKRKTLQEALDEAAKPLTKREQEVKKDVESRGFVYAAGKTCGTIFNRRES